MIDADFILSTETECLTVLGGESAGENRSRALIALLRTMGALAPALPGVEGFFNSYGRVYIDSGGHLELAACECSSPYELPILVETQQALVARALVRLREQGVGLLLANNNHSGLLKPDTATWGSHENYLVKRHPGEFGAEILPFLCTRIYGGCGGILYPEGAFLAGVRPLFMVHVQGGSTTARRAIHSTGREEHLVGRLRGRWRYHLILGDGHRSHFNLALQMGATALALKAIDFDPELGGRVRARFGLPQEDSWLAMLRRCNTLAPPHRELAVEPLVWEVQREYLEGARRYATALERAPDWIARLLADWEATLAAMERGDLEWLSARLDSFAKYRLFSEVLAARQTCWGALGGQRVLLSELALLDQSYHRFADPDSAFARLERAGVLAHRVGAAVEPGGEEEPHVPALATRARARARFIVEHAARARRSGMQVDWSGIMDHDASRYLRLDDPLAQDFEVEELDSCDAPF